MGATSLEVWLILVAGFLFSGVVASKFSAKLGIPALLFYLAIGMLAGSDGPGGIHFDDMAIAKTVGTVALAFILFAGGLDSSLIRLRPVLRPGILLSTFGVAVSCLLVGLFVHYVLKLPLVVGLLLGAVVSSTDAAAVFGVLRSSGLRVKGDTTPLLEFESGTNDPVAIFLTLSLTQYCLDPSLPLSKFIVDLLLEMPIGVGIGWLTGIAAVAVINRIRLEYDGLYPAITIAAASFAFGAAELSAGNPFLSVYVAGVTMGSRNFIHRLALIQFHDALAWLTQIVMFVVLGLLVFPHQLPAVIGSGLLVSAFLLLVARPVSVFLALFRSRFDVRDKLFISWAGLRGAVPIVLATFPAIAGLPEAQTIFNLVFFIVVTSVLIQGTTLKPLAKRLGVAESPPKAPGLVKTTGDDLLRIVVPSGARVVGRQVVELGLPATALIVLLRRNGEAYVPRGSTVIEPGDELLLASRRHDHDELRRRFK